MWRDSTRLFDMLDSARLVMEYVAGLTGEDFKQRVGVQDKVLWRLMVIGEAAKNVSEAYRRSHPEIEWQGIAGFRRMEWRGASRARSVATGSSAPMARARISVTPTRPKSVPMRSL